MLHRRIAETRGFRPLNASELETVSGGIEQIIFVTGRRPSDPVVGGGGGGGGGGNETGNSPDPTLGSDGGGIALPVDFSLDPGEGTATVSVDIVEGVVSAEGVIELDGFNLKTVSLTVNNNGNTVTFELEVNSLDFGFETQFNLGNGAILGAFLQLNEDGTFDNAKVIFKITF
jgi:hypothetical protein